MSRNSGSLVQSQVFEDYVASVKSQSEDLIKNKFPKRIRELNDLLASPEFDMELQMSGLSQDLNIPVPDAQAVTRALRYMNGGGGGDEDETPKGKKRRLNNHVVKNDHHNSLLDDHVDNAIMNTGGTKVLALPSGPVMVNQTISKMFDFVKPQIRSLVEYANLLKMWVTFLIPKIEDGNNFGVSIQEDTLGEIRTVEAETATYYEQIARYHMSRAKLISKVAKYPHIDDYRRSVIELDEKEFISLKLIVSEIRNHYASLYDLIGKNWEKIIKPRTSNSENLY